MATYDSVVGGIGVSLASTIKVLHSTAEGRHALEQAVQALNIGDMQVVMQMHTRLKELFKIRDTNDAAEDK